MNRRIDNFAESAVAEAALAAIICAAGSSTRMGEGIKKEYCPLPGGITVLGKAVGAFAAIRAIKTIVITVPQGGEADARGALPPELLAGENGPVLHFVQGGGTRQASVYNALTLLATNPPDYVLIHDGARPWVSASLITRVIAVAQKHRAAIPLLPLTETPKETDVPLNAPNGAPNGGGSDTIFIKRHIKRAFVGAAQTPQAFAFPEIFAAYQKAQNLLNKPLKTSVFRGFPTLWRKLHQAIFSKANSKTQQGFLNLPFTDDAEVWALVNGPVAAIPGESANRKITFPEDLR